MDIIYDLFLLWVFVVFLVGLVAWAGDASNGMH